MDKKYFIELNGRQIPVSKEVYYAFKRPAWKERKRRQVREEKELSLEAFADAGFEIPSGQALVDEIVEDKLLLDMLSKALSELTDEERLLIDELFYNSKSERQVAKETGISQTTLNYQKNKIIKRLRKKLNLE
ncbi:sigma-70 family RNA polymerase sigma factor [Petrotoga olearia]|uniref:Sigma-70 family RNA polymerase sigma factor n=2 Tax=Petrotoga olearia TaxID=156203 RepID=A0A2K1P5F5_9BACT|nr:sigma-70 family RNA polymerase sigma factor [Petrotoga olearia]PNR98011.1 sigma-70 family RNA polymerase sigma factor [Petrotoga olearia DSM 13574]